MKKSNKKFWFLKLIGMTVIFASPILSYAICNYIQSSNNNSTNDIEMNTSKNTRTAITPNTSLRLNTNNALYWADDIIDDTNYFGNISCTINGGILVGTKNNGIKYVNQDTGSVTLFTNNFIGSLIDIKYNAALGRILVLSYTNTNKLVLSLFDMNGSKLSNVIMLDNISSESSTSYALFNINNSNEYLITNNQKCTATERSIYTKKFKISSGGVSNVEYVFWSENDGVTYNIVAMGNIKMQVNKVDKNICVQLVTNGSRWLFKLFNDWRIVKEFELSSNMSPSWTVNSGVKTLNEIVIQQSNNNITGTTLVSGDKSMLFNLSISDSEIKLISDSADGFISFNDSSINIDVKWASVFNNIITFSASHWSTNKDTTIENKMSIGALNIADPTNSSSPLTKNNILSYSTSSKQNTKLRRYDHFSNNVTVKNGEKFRVLGASNFSIQSGNLISIRNPNFNDIWFIDASKNEAGGWAYLTSLLNPNSEIRLDNAQDINPLYVTSSDMQNNQTIIESIKSGFTLFRVDSDITITKKENQYDYWATGKVPVTVSFNKGYDSNGNMTNMQFDVILTGFAQYENTTNIPEQISLSGVNNILASDINKYKNIVARAIVNSNQITNIALQQQLTENDIEIEPIMSSANNVEQMIDVNLIIKNNKYWNNGEIHQNSPAFRVKLTGFKIQCGTSWKNINEIDNSEWRSLYPTEISDDQIIQFVRNNINNFFENIPDSSRIIVVSKEPDVINGKLKVKFQLSEWYDTNGILQNTNSQIYSLTFLNLKNDNLSTLIFPNMNLNLSDTYASSLTLDNSLMENVKQTIINKNFIYNVANNQTLTTSDLNIQIENETVNNVLGEVKVILTINNSKYWNNGVVSPSYSQEVTLTGFKRQNATEQVENVFYNPAWSQIAAANFSSNDILTFINERKDVFFINLPSDARVVLVDNSLRPNGGTLDFQVSLSKYYNEKGIESFNSPAFDIRFEGFKTTNITTFIPSTIALDNVENILASDVTENQYSIRNDIYEKRDLFININGTLNMSDISFTIDEANNVKQELVINLNIGNGKFWNNGVIEENKTQRIKLTGFKLQKATNTNISIPFPSNSQNIDEQIQDLLNYINSGAIKPDEAPYYIPDSNNDGIINEDDFTIKVVEKNEYDENGNITNTVSTIVVIPNKYYDEKGILQPNFVGNISFQTSREEIKNSPSQSGKIDWKIIIIVCSVVGGILLLLLLYLLIRSCGKRDSYDDFDYVDYY